mmetsp:Transcript_14469/g.22967  ORF Transcript_14469/g.22967 Transcript_14469/m.22967 type:complete len:81 (+) Transcript_14469:1953-2195(+)
MDPESTPFLLIRLVLAVLQPRSRFLGPMYIQWWNLWVLPNVRVLCAAQTNPSSAPSPDAMEASPSRKQGVDNLEMVEEGA